MEEKIVKLGDNNVEVRKVVYDKDGKEIVLPAYTKSYGRDVVTNELEVAQKKIDFWKGVVAKDYVDTQIAEAEATKTKLQSVQTLLDG